MWIPPFAALPTRPRPPLWQPVAGEAGLRTGMHKRLACVLDVFVLCVVVFLSLTFWLWGEVGVGGTFVEAPGVGRYVFCLKIECSSSINHT